ncbi:hypothetical protein HGP14_03385 [Rhizobium sp. P32RR-XVIII]|uniref:hypothetical protein n=1 Tax=Rhizobium sp. P32RR-XVIII TaxID=2726738 RepID=UPI00145678AA|nr:hypothetical protein [Rhizobium sp. P32RR-XVIII]NLS02415.1 hypothetical protein [Rhizobium sp. P32RR-XVIII]
MVKLVLTGIWVCVITLASVYFSVKMATAPAAPADSSKESQLELVKGETITVPIIGNGAITGYFLGRVSYMMNKDTVKGATLPLTEMTTDELFTLLMGNKMVDISKLKSFDPQAFRDAIKKDMNEKLGGDYVSEVILEQLEYLSKEEVKANASGQQQKTGNPIKIIDAPSPAAAAAAAAH